MSAVEASKWAAYMKKRGSLNLAAHIETGLAEVMALIVRRTGGNASVRDYMHYFKPTPSDVDEGEATLDDIMSVLTGAMHNVK